MLGRYSVFVNRYVCMIKYLCKVVNTNNATFKCLYKSLLEDCQRGVNNWESNVKSLLKTYGFSTNRNRKV